MIKLSKRLQTVADFVTEKTVADIGTDHGYVPVYLHKKGNVTKVIACDINQKPLERAKKHIKAFQAEGVIQTRLGNGLQPLKPYEVESVILSGMGGMLMTELLEQSKEVVDTIKECILCPHLDVPEVRRYLHKIGFCIQKEKMVEEEQKFYVILYAVKGKEEYENEIEYLFGKVLLEKKDAVLKQYIQKEKIRLEKLKKVLQKNETKQTKMRLKEITKQIQYVKEAEVWLYCAKKL